MKWLLHIALLVWVGRTGAQELTFGFIGGFNLYQKIQWDKAIHFAPNTYYTYVEDGFGNGLLDKNAVFNGAHAGIFMGAKYKRFTLNAEPQYYYSRTYLSFERPFFVERIIGKKAFRMPVYAAVKFFKSPKSPFLLIGLNPIKEKNWDFQSPGVDAYFGEVPPDLTLFQSGNDHFSGALYDNRFYVNYLVGLGFSTKKMNYSFRFQKELKFTRHQIEANIWQIEMSVNFAILSSKDFTKKHFLYAD